VKDPPTSRCRVAAASWTDSTCATSPAGWNAKERAAPVVAFTRARLRLGWPPAVVKVPPSRIDPSGAHSTVLTIPLTFGFQLVTA